ncbi:hypothetical protein HPB48_012898 [Haemaphysalis longicornis]|uniref:THAP-type domain-containing protein n=1 Tax=Haemaphysalis longicornis TaxID=44386 RepID=A0A9J6GI56_HAELO|nr:hypothetical protein HPB48_012898 [Haemaphysalis longicornis]
MRSSESVAADRPARPWCTVAYRTVSHSQVGTQASSFHQFPSDAELVAKWLKNISRQNLVVNDKSVSTVVCSRHFLSTDYVPGCRIRKLLPGALLTKHSCTFQAQMYWKY